MLKNFCFKWFGFKFFNPKIFYNKNLSTESISISLITIQNLYIYITNENKEQNAYISLNVNRFFNYFVLIIKFLTLLFYLGLY